MERTRITDFVEILCRPARLQFNKEMRSLSGHNINEMEGLRKIYGDAFESQSLILILTKNGNPDGGFATIHGVYEDENGNQIYIDETIHDQNDVALLTELQKEFSPGINEYYKFTKVTT